MIKENLDRLRSEIEKTAQDCHREASEIQLLAVTKGRSVEEIQAAYDLGLRDFGENRLKEALEKRDRLPEDIRWHFIGHLQRNKVAAAISAFVLIHSVDSLELAQKISKSSLERNLVTSVLIEVNTSCEATKHGFHVEQCEKQWHDLCQLKGISIQGLMTMAPFTQDVARIHAAFRELREFRDCYAKELKILSMGMSLDFQIAIEEGATLLRIGSALFD